MPIHRVGLRRVLEVVSSGVRRGRMALIGAGVVAVAAAVAGAQPCAPGWSDGFRQPGTSGYPYAGVQTAVMYDEDGPQGPARPALVIGGVFESAGGERVQNVARWTGSSWAPLGPLDFTAVRPQHAWQLLTFNDGSAPFPRLYMIGDFWNSTSRFRRFEPATNSWEVPAGADITNHGYWNCAAVFDADNGAGPRLYLSSGFNQISGGVSLGTIAVFDGVTWTSADFPFGPVTLLSVIDLDGPGPGAPDLVACGYDGVFRLIDGAWVRVTTGGFNSSILSVAVFDEDGDGPNPPRLFVGGSFSTVSGVDIRGVARWDGTNWTGLDTGVTGGSVYALSVIDDGAGPQLYVGGDFWTAGGSFFRSCFAKWTGSAWADSAIGSGLVLPPINPATTGGTVFILRTLEDEDGPALLVGGKFNLFGNVMSGDVALRRGTTWRSLGAGSLGDVWRLLLHDDGQTPGGAIYGLIPVSARNGTITSMSVCRYRPDGWEYVSARESGSVNALTSHTFPGDSRPSLVAGGQFTVIGNQSIKGIAKYNGQAWSSLGGGDPDGLISTVSSLTLPGQTHPVLVAGGAFQNIGETVLNRIAYFDGAVWRPLGMGVGHTAGFSKVTSAVMFDDGTGAGPRLIVGGTFDSAGGVPASRVAAWDGASWSAMGDGLSPTLTSDEVHLIVFDDDAEGPNPPRLYAGGRFDIPGSSARNFARWNGVQWEPPASALPDYTVASMTVHDPDGPGGPARPLLIVGGGFSRVGSVTYFGLAAFDGSEWSQVTGIPGPTSSSKVNASISIPASMHGPARLFVGGHFETLNNVPSSNVALLTGCPRCPADFDDSGEVNTSDIARFIQVWAASVASGTLGGDFDADQVVTPVDVAAFVKVWLGAVQGGC
ncbi:MAG: hypothetical protein KF745_09620 [Phycisphaeraceae bacterium]|nr:hypothetical protein [Phycisphaeraceae bacterium]